MPVFILELARSITTVFLVAMLRNFAHVYRLIVAGLQSISSSIAKVADGRRLLSARSTFSDLCHGLVVVANNRRRGLVHVPNTATSERGLARCIIVCWGVDVAGVLFDRFLDVAEDIAFEERPRRSTFDSVADVVVPEVIDNVDDGVAAELRRAALGVGNVVVLERDGVLGAG